MNFKLFLTFAIMSNDAIISWYVILQICTVIPTENIGIVIREYEILINIFNCPTYMCCSNLRFLKYGKCLSAPCLITQYYQTYVFLSILIGNKCYFSIIWICISFITMKAGYLFIILRVMCISFNDVFVYIISTFFFWVILFIYRCFLHISAIRSFCCYMSCNVF